MKHLIYIILLIVVITSCKTSKGVVSSNDANNDVTEKKDTIRIVNDEIEYEVIIFEVGFNAWMARRARPKEFYSLTYLEARNLEYVTEWNRRATSGNFNSNLYEMQINYLHGIDYGLDVNYILYHYFVFFEEKYNQNLTVHNPRF
ncbi:DUF6146 family protein [Hanstruepera ponticola]|uniref:DUF6146 family protein n=1 Tax=Hanstruepera ponticola TaxID=2042995 RepID=UPI000CF0E42C|nr:DUF6146 family protein [Hanstruepera ponticola]